MLSPIFNFIGSVVFGILPGITIGVYLEKRHFASLNEREDAYRNIFISNDKKLMQPIDPSRGCQLVTGEVVIAFDGLKAFLTKWRKVFGGEMNSLCKMQDRAVREAKLRMIEAALALGHNAVINARFEVCDVHGSVSDARGNMTNVAIIASGTACTIE